MTVSAHPSAVHDRLTPRARGLLLVLCGALFLDALDVSMKGVALPSIGAELGMATGSLQWVVSGYVLGFGGFLLLGGRAADLLGRRRMLIGALAVFAVATALGGLATSGPLLIAARFVTGISAAFSAPAGFSIITTSFADGPVRNKALSIYTATGATGFSLGLVAGGLLTELSWRWVFHAPVLVALVTLAGALAVVPRTAAAPGRGFDIAGSATVTAAMLLLVFTLVEAPNAGWASVRTLGSLVAVAALLAVFVVIERRVASPLLRLGILRSGPLVRANVAAMSLLGGWVGALFIVTLYLQGVRGWSALETGLAVCPSGIVVAVLAPRIAAPLVGRYGSGRVALAGLTSSVAAYALLQFLDASSGYATLMLPAFLLVGLAFTLTYGPLTMAAADSVPAADQGLAGGLVNTAFQIGPALTLGVVSAVTATGSLRAALVVPLIVAALGVAAMLPALRRA
ncbi:MFS transporter [Amycolatopsis sp. A133]|uniref:MFS transporter n=1 Tax=Amycolatopsis sp. A133 TaxID=3064472 RepID=UPI0027EC7EF8|nr:MFS transporter [Amycolatopsis sp. A133]MDQ7806885.1 MFS transporter [Amycolatopsis sp. A133]